jgi:hypothetical protein
MQSVQRRQQLETRQRAQPQQLQRQADHQLRNQQKQMDEQLQRSLQGALKTPEPARPHQQALGPRLGQTPRITFPPNPAPPRTGKLAEALAEHRRRTPRRRWWRFR